jgi:tetratricopeptide (TPR) repeat protein
LQKLRNVLIAVLVLSVGIIGLITYRVLYPWVMDYRKYLILSQLADQGDPGYQRLLAEYLYDKGDFETALKWELRSAEGEDPIAQNFMGDHFSYGINDQLKPARPDYAKAREWYEKAAVQGFKSSQVELCEIYYRGLGVSSDREAAYFWCSLSEPLERATKFKQLSRDTLDPDSQQRVERRLVIWIDSHRKGR